jgi:hypothetical protein
MKIKEWDLGKAEKTGSVNLFSGKEKNKGNSKGILEFENKKLPNPVADTKTLPFVQKMDAVTKIIDGIKLKDGLKNEAELLAAKVEIMRLLQESIDITVNDENFKKIEKRLQHYILKLGEIKEKYDQWSLRQEIKKQQPDKFADKFKPNYPKQLVNQFALGASKTIDKIAEDAVELLLPRDYKSIANERTSTKSKGLGIE